MTTPLPAYFQTSLDGFYRSMAGKNRSPKTVLAYSTDLQQFLGWVVENDATVETVADIQRVHIIDFLASLSERKLTGVSRARKLAAIREYCRYLVNMDLLEKSPATGVDTPKIEHNGKAWLRPDEYSRMLSLAAGNPRDYCILTVFLQTGIRVSELCNLRINDIDLKAKQLSVRSGKGMNARQISLETKGIKALKTWLQLRPSASHDHIFTNERDGGAITERGVRMLVTKYRENAGITKQASCHALRHTFATVKASKGVSPYQLQRLLGHSKLDTTMVYVHLGRENEAAVMEETSL
ncbi:MAG: tyrosine-type recombinase/integrase [Thermomicrobiales bacterium]